MMASADYACTAQCKLVFYIERIQKIKSFSILHLEKNEGCQSLQIFFCFFGQHFVIPNGEKHWHTQGGMPSQKMPLPFNCGQKKALNSWVTLGNPMVPHTRHFANPRQATSLTLEQIPRHFSQLHNLLNGRSMGQLSLCVPCPQQALCSVWLAPRSNIALCALNPNLEPVINES